MVLHEGSECHCANEPHAATTAFVITSLAPPVAVGVHKLGQAAAIRPRASLLVTGSETAKATCRQTEPDTTAVRVYLYPVAGTKRFLAALPRHRS
jgi:hypothetical protein